MKNVWDSLLAPTYKYELNYVPTIFGSATPCAFPPPWPSIFSHYSFFVHHPVNRDDRHLLALAMASGFSVTRQFSQREKLVFRYGSNSKPLSNRSHPVLTPVHGIEYFVGL
jgi:hypothetical protein